MHSPRPSRSQAFTLIELLVVIAIIAILSIVVVLTLNPAQLLQSGRDSNRVSDMATLNSALGIYAAEGGSSLGSSSVVYVSIPDPTATSTAGDQCQGLGLLSLPAAYSYHCAASSTFRNVNGTGWIPVNFNSLTAGAPLGSLPIDPINTSSSRLYYTYDTNGSQYEVTSVMESSKYQIGGSNDVISNDGGTLASVYEKGSIFGLEPLDYGDSSLIGYWNFNEGTGTVAYDYSGNNATGSWSGSQVGTNGYYSTNAKVTPYAGAFDGTSTYVNVPSEPQSSNVTMCAWVNSNNPFSLTNIVGGPNGGTEILSYPSIYNDYFQVYQGNTWISTGIPIVTSTWNFPCLTYQGANKTLQLYYNGSLTTTNTAGSFTYGQLGVIGVFQGSPPTIRFFPGLIDDVRVYNKVLSASQIAAMYAGGK